MTVTRDSLGGRHPQRHLVLDEADDDQFELGAGDLLLLDRDDLAHAMGGVHHELAGLEALPLGRLLDGHSGSMASGWAPLEINATLCCSAERAVESALGGVGCVRRGILKQLPTAF